MLLKLIEVDAFGAMLAGKFLIVPKPFTSSPFLHQRGEPFGNDS
jgi:hypothetical protein